MSPMRPGPLSLPGLDAPRRRDDASISRTHGGPPDARASLSVQLIALGDTTPRLATLPDDRGTSTVRPGRRRRHRSAAYHPHRAAELHHLTTSQTIFAASSSTRPIFPGSSLPLRRMETAAAMARRLSFSSRDEFTPLTTPPNPLPAIQVSSLASAARSGGFVELGACADQRRHSLADAMATAPGTVISRLSVRAGSIRRPATRLSWFRRSRSGARPASGQDVRQRRAKPIQHGRRHRRSRSPCRTTTSSSSTPATRATSNRWCVR